MTEAERRVWNILRERGVEGFKFRRQVPLGSYIVDFACLEARLVVEIDGGQHGGERDAQRDRWLSEQGFAVLRFWNNEVVSNIEGIHARISEVLQAMGIDRDREPRGRARAARVTPIPTLPPLRGKG